MTRRSSGVVLAAAVGWLAAPCEVEACGGTFCDGGPFPMPVDQSGENILFVTDGATVEAHVQIQYQGDPAKFAWIVPVLAQPDVEVGSEALFDELLRATVPTFTLRTRREDCDDGSGAMGCGLETVALGDAALSAGGSGGGDGFDEGPQIVGKGTAGSFQYVVLQGSDAPSVTAWLEDNGYAPDEDAPPILAEYLDEGFLLLAFKMLPGATRDEIHPIVIRYEGDEACVPIRLTRIAATEDMPIRTFFLGDARVAPKNYRSVEINPLFIDWSRPTTSYAQAVSLAVDGEGADGRAFVTEYAGRSAVLDRSAIALVARSEAYVTATPVEAIEQLKTHGLIACRFGGPFLEDGACAAQHPQLVPLMDRYLPTPLGVDASTFWANPRIYEGALDLDAWSGEAFAADLEERIVGPAEHATALLDANGYLTRLYTVLSPHEMTADPLFHANADLPVVSSSWVATRVTVCDGTDYVELADGRRIAVDDGGERPGVAAAVSVAEVPPRGPVMKIVDNEAEIDEAVARWNDEHDLGGGAGCRIAGRLSGLAWMGLILGFLGFARRPRQRLSR